MDNLVTSRSARWKVFGILLLIICIVGVIKGFISGRYTSDSITSTQSPTAIKPQKVDTNAMPQHDAVSTVDSLLADIRKRNTAAPTSSPETLPENFSGWDQPKPKTLSICQMKVDEWQQWYDGNVAVLGDLKTSNIQLKQENDELNYQNSRLRTELKRAEPIALFSGLLGFGAGISIIFRFGKWIRRAPRPWLALSLEKRKLLLLIGGAAWISVVVMICSQKQILYLHPINLLVAVVVYSIPAVLFDGIAFWWLRNPKKT
jgi:hypothetical protein